MNHAYLYTTSPRGGKEIEKKGRKAAAGGEAAAVREEDDGARGLSAEE